MTPLARLARLLRAQICLSLLVACLCAAPASASAVAPASSGASAEDAGVEAYRRGEWSAARDAWLAAWQDPALSSGARARLAYNLGNACYRAGATPRAGAWYELALVLDPSFPAARANLDHVRTSLGLPPLDRGDLSGTFLIAASSLRAAEWRLAAFVLLGIGTALWLLASPSRSRAWRAGALAAFFGLLVCLAAAAFGDRREDPARAWLVGQGRSDLRSEPRDGAAVVGDAGPLEHVEVLDSLLDWTKVRTAGGVEGWTRSEGVFAPSR